MTSAGVDTITPDRGIGRNAGKPGVYVLPLPSDTRERLTAFYRECDEADALCHASGSQKVRGTVWADGLKRLERGEEVYESFGVLARAGIDLPPAASTMLAKLPEDWRRICQIDADGVVRTASLKARRRFGR